MLAASEVAESIPNGGYARMGTVSIYEVFGKIS